MHDSRMIAEVCPPGVCAIEKVSGRRIATPLAPPRPGSTPMITPSRMPTSISARLVRLSATAKPWKSDCRSAITMPSVQPEQRLERPLGQRNEEPDLEDEIEHDAVADRHQRHLPPRVLAEPAHEQRDEQRARDVDAEPADQAGEHCGGHEHGEHEPELAELDESAVLLAAQAERHERRHRRREADQQSDVEREIARLRPV